MLLIFLFYFISVQRLTTNIIRFRVLNRLLIIKITLNYILYIINITCVYTLGD